MIVRTWHGIVPIAKAEGFKKYIDQTGVAEVISLPGNLGVCLHTQTQNEYEHFFMVSYWKGYEAIKAFAGPDYHIAVTYPEDDLYELISDPIVLHHKVKEISSQFPMNNSGYLKNSNKREESTYGT
jgi:heme-degrading monooxygenase HmoA